MCVFYCIVACAKSCFTVVLHYGGAYVNCNGDVKYQGGKIRKWDYFLLKDLTFGLLKAYCDGLKIVEVKKVHVKLEDGGWLYIGSNADLKKAYKDYLKDRELHLWIDGDVQVDGDSGSVGDNNVEAVNVSEESEDT